MKINELKAICSNFAKHQKVMVDKRLEIAILIRENYIKSVILTHSLIQEEFGKYEVDEVEFDEKNDRFNLTLKIIGEEYKLPNKSNIFNNCVYRKGDKYIHIKIGEFDEDMNYAKALKRIFIKDMSDIVVYSTDKVIDLKDKIIDYKDDIEHYREDIVGFDIKIDSAKNKLNKLKYIDDEVDRVYNEMVDKLEGGK